jgi:cytochrome c biogenesis factor
MTNHFGFNGVTSMVTVALAVDGGCVLRQLRQLLLHRLYAEDRARLICICDGLSGTIPVPSVRHHKLLAHIIFNCYQTSYIVCSTLYPHVHKLFLMKNALCSEIESRLFVTLFEIFTRMIVRLRATSHLKVWKEPPERPSISTDLAT